ncbi:MAG: sarcosine oxidase subunit alpha family protein [Alphaproteobacteria bacterium]|mgnify:FL=1|jgi:sarcosine oxidase, subunit alpha|nr:sarcosine oxidase subunit alpha family protein [Alphaproteobacteria bacterium]
MKQKQPHRLPANSQCITREKTVQFTFDGKKYIGYEGDSLASALLANGVSLVGRSFKYHRPRGILSCGSEEPNALIRVIRASSAEPNLRATQIEIYDGLIAESQNRFPNLKLDFLSINSLFSSLFPAGFYYKTFMWPASLWMFYEKIIRRAAGLGKVSTTDKDTDRYEHKYAHCDVLVVGAGVAGLQAAYIAATSGARVIIADENRQFGGWLLTDNDFNINNKPALIWANNIINKLHLMPNVTCLVRTTIFANMDDNFIVMAERVTEHLSQPDAHLPKQRLWKLRTAKTILATGAIERPLTFSGNDLPGIMLAAAIRSYIHRYDVLPGTRAIIFTNNDDAYYTALAIHQAGGFIRCIVDLRDNPKSFIITQIRNLGIDIRFGHAVIAAHGVRHIASVNIAKYDSKAAQPISNIDHIDCNLLAMSGGLNPVVHLHSQRKGNLIWDERTACYRPENKSDDWVAIGAANGTFQLARILSEATKIATSIISKLAKNNQRLEMQQTPEMPVSDEAKQNWAPLPVWSIESAQSYISDKTAFVDFQNDSTVADIKLAVREGYHSVEHVKRYTTTGMATDQGKTSNINAIGILANTLNKSITQTGTTTFRLPYTPTSLGAIAGRGIGSLFDPIRTTRMHSWHHSNDAKFEHVGQWMRAWYYPREGESFQQTINREVHATRHYAGLLDASTLGKIDVKGPDAAEFLNRVYTNNFATLPIGKCRYGLMLKEDGMVFDDGVTTRLAEDHFYMTTTSGGAAGVLAWLEELLQTEWSDLNVYLTSVTEQWSVASLSGPNAKAILKASMSEDTDITDDFPFMTMKDSFIAGLPVRIFRISFTGEMSFELNVPARYGLALWSHLMRVGKSFNLTAYGTEAMHVLRAEKGFIIVGQETDGTVTPYDLDMSWIVSKKKADFIGKRALARASMNEPHRKQLVGLITKDPDMVIPEGAHAVIDPNKELPMAMLGHVTSSYYSPNLKHSIAMGLLKDGLNRKGQTVFFPMLDGQAPIEAKIVDPIFFDKQGDRLRG